MTDAVMVALITGGSGIVAGVLGVRGYDKVRANGRTNGNGNSQDSVAHVIAQRAEVEFQTRMTMLMNSLTEAVTKGNAHAAEQLSKAATGIKDAAATMRDVRTEMLDQRDLTSETHKMVGELHGHLMKEKGT